ncbi:hypothetical protein GPALN_014653 [Globodera pallida]|nr:hypothetical protein GPALN_014653 [Globodera pallida]
MENIRDQVAPYLPKFLAHYLQALSSDDCTTLLITDHRRRNLPSFVLNRQTLLGIGIAGCVGGVNSQPERALTTRDLEFVVNEVMAKYSWTMMATFVAILVIVLAMCVFMFVLYNETREMRNETRLALHGLGQRVQPMWQRIDMRMQQMERNIDMRMQQMERRIDQRMQQMQQRISHNPFRIPVDNAAEKCNIS